MLAFSLTGVTVISGVMLSDQFTSMPLVDRDVLMICNFQLPLASSPIRLDRRPLGLNDPVKGLCRW